MTSLPPIARAHGRSERGTSRGRLRALVVEDSAALRGQIVAGVGKFCAEVIELASGTEALESLRQPESRAFDVVVSDLRPEGVAGLGLALLDAALGLDPASRVLLTGWDSRVEDVVDAMRGGACDFLAKPFELSELERRIASALDCAADDTRDVAAGAAAGAAIHVIAESPSMREAVDLAIRVAGVRSSVLLTGETGTGKEVLAGLLHSASPRSRGPFVKVNCAALPEPLLESELFGHEVGAFTGADRQRIGRFEEASGGTLFLDEIGEMSPSTQAKLLRVLQDQEFHRLGGTRPLRTDARIVAATNLDLEKAIAAGVFREDLYFRLDVIGIHLPPLRERREDTIALADYFLVAIGREMNRRRCGFTPSARERITHYDWPGNVRELRNAIERALLLSGGPLIQATDLGIPEPEGCQHAAPGWQLELPPDGISLETVQRELVLAALRRTRFVQKEAAELIGVSARKLNYMIARMGLTHRTWRRNRADAPRGFETPDAECEIRCDHEGVPTATDLKIRARGSS